MTHSCITLQGVCWALPDGTPLFCDLNEQFDSRHTGLVGRNGVGKSVLARILAGLVQPTRGHCTRQGRVHYLAQQITPAAGASVASLAGVQPVLAALARIEQGSCAVEDFEAVGEGWDIRQRLQQALHANGLGELEADRPASTLSGGQAMRVSLIGAALAQADFLILDEPSNHLDQPARQALIEQLQAWPRGLLVISHDRSLLEVMQRTVELSSLGLRSYGGPYGFYAQCKAQEQHSAVLALEHSKAQRRRDEQAMRQQHERQERRQAHGRQQGRHANQAAIIQGRQKERSEGSTGRLREQHAALQARLALQVHEAAQRVEDAALIALQALPAPAVMSRCVATLEALTLPFVGTAPQRIDLLLGGQQRVGVVGANGCGKSTLLKVLAGQLMPASGVCRVTPDTVYLDQQQTALDPARPVLEQLQAVNRKAGVSELRTRLAQLGLDARKVESPSGRLSGGERLKAALACVLYADPVPSLVLLDEPGNHLDLPSIQALETLLRDYQGALMVVSHDQVLLDNLRLTHRLRGSEQGWRLEAW
ncbi:ABC-F family ATP-binding cassette domain-containing protein [Pseudomonas syringae]|nr:ABC-F family ATP-binding cassette domain-containing protein [Pseudomonas syringae]MBD8789781.1 ABC-F family ATP-binding cassette domain-containing protein [Pseudomonas syringae]MBD8800970.1 ABC-F family ATP-binding cassette domain-containing protein [Pseudomonas syringae]MBD8812351.1 ABC-F family ATP-binding cassette domain-containing protein [Pseudomonas syringae]